MKLKKGTAVKWKWGRGMAEGKVVGTTFNKVARKIKGSSITRNGSPSNPALDILQKDGTRVLKLQTEVKKA